MLMMWMLFAAVRHARRKFDDRRMQRRKGFRKQKHNQGAMDSIGWPWYS